MPELDDETVKLMAEAMGVNVIDAELPLLRVRLNGMIELVKSLRELPLDNIEIVPTLLTQRED